MFFDLIRLEESEQFFNFCEKVNENLAKINGMLQFEEKKEIKQKVVKNFKVINYYNNIFQIDLIIFYEKEPEKFKNNFKLYKNFFNNLDYTRKNKYYYQNFLNELLKFFEERKAKKYE